MNRIKKNTLIQENNRYFYQYKPFTGIIFDVVGQQIIEIFECKDGVREKEYQSKFVLKEPGDQCIDFAVFFKEGELESEPYLYNGKGYTGLYYEFEKDTCTLEGRCIDGIRIEEACWFFSGVLEFYWTSYKNDIYQSYNWYENGFFESIDICDTKNDHALEITFTEKQEITSITISSEYLKKYSEFEHHLKYHYLVGDILPEEAKISPRLFVSGLGVDDKFFFELQSCVGFSEVETIIINNTSVTNDSLSSLANYQCIKKIRVVKDSEEEILLALNELKSKQPNCCIELNTKEI